MKIDRLLAITVLLLNRGRISSKELADRFEVSTKTIYRDMETLSRAGIPIASIQGTSGGFEMMERYTIARQFLTPTEISTLAAAVEGVGRAMDDGMLDTLLGKVKALANRSAVERGTELLFDFRPWGRNDSEREKVNLLRQAISESRLAQIRYWNRNGSESDRVIEPVSLVLKGYVWYLYGYCTLRSEFRWFRISRVQELRLLSAHFAHRVTPPLDDDARASEGDSDRLRDVALSFHPAVRYRVSDMFDPALFTTLEDGWIRVEGRFAEDEGLYAMILSYGDRVRVERPANIAEEIVRRARNLIEQYSK